MLNGTWKAVLMCLWIIGYVPSAAVFDCVLLPVDFVVILLASMLSGNPKADCSCSGLVNCVLSAMLSYCYFELLN